MTDHFALGLQIEILVRDLESAEDDCSHLRRELAAAKDQGNDAYYSVLQRLEDADERRHQVDVDAQSALMEYWRRDFYARR